MSISNILVDNDYQLHANTVNANALMGKGNNAIVIDVRSAFDTGNTPNVVLRNHAPNPDTGDVQSYPFNVLIGEGINNNTIITNKEGPGETSCTLNFKVVNASQNISTSRLDMNNAQCDVIQLGPANSDGLGSYGISVGSFDGNERFPVITASYVYTNSANASDLKTIQVNYASSGSTGDGNYVIQGTADKFVAYQVIWKKL